MHNIALFAPHLYKCGWGVVLLGAILSYEIAWEAAVVDSIYLESSVNN